MGLKAKGKPNQAAQDTEIQRDEVGRNNGKGKEVRPSFPPSIEKSHGIRSNLNSQISLFGKPAMASSMK
jgi:hypothetical protein